MSYLKQEEMSKRSGNNSLINPSAHTNYEHELPIAGKTITDPARLAAIFSDVFLSSVKDLALQLTLTPNRCTIKHHRKIVLICLRVEKSTYLLFKKLLKLLYVFSGKPIHP